MFGTFNAFYRRWFGLGACAGPEAAGMPWDRGVGQGREMPVSGKGGIWIRK